MRPHSQFSRLCIHMSLSFYKLRYIYFACELFLFVWSVFLLLFVLQCVSIMLIAFEYDTGFVRLRKGVDSGGGGLDSDRAREIIDRGWGIL